MTEQPDARALAERARKLCMDLFRLAGHTNKQCGGCDLILAALSSASADSALTDRLSSYLSSLPRDTPGREGLSPKIDPREEAVEIIRALLDGREEAEERAQEAEKALREADEYTWHMMGCPLFPEESFWDTRKPDPCNCGYRQMCAMVRAALRARAGVQGAPDA